MDYNEENKQLDITPAMQPEEAGKQKKPRKRKSFGFGLILGIPPALNTKSLQTLQPRHRIIKSPTARRFPRSRSFWLTLIYIIMMNMMRMMSVMQSMREP